MKGTLEKYHATFIEDSKKLKGGVEMRKNVLGVFALAAIALLGLGVASAQGFGFGQDLSEEDMVQMQEERAAIEDAVETGDYAAWEGLMQERLARMEDSINEETFARLAERHEQREQMRAAMDSARESGDFSEVETLREEFSFGDEGCMMRGHDGMMPRA